MNTKKLSHTLLWVVLAGAVLSALGVYRYFRIAPELRFAEIEARWLTVPFVLLALLAAALLVGHMRNKRPPSL